MRFLSWLALLVCSFIMYLIISGINILRLMMMDYQVFSDSVIAIFLSFMIFFSLSVLIIYGGYKGTYILSEGLYPSKDGQRYWVIGSAMVVLLICSLLGERYAEGSTTLSVTDIMESIYFGLLIIKGIKLGKVRKQEKIVAAPSAKMPEDKQV